MSKSANEFWEGVERTAKSVDQWPDWKKQGSVVPTGGSKQSGVSSLEHDVTENGTNAAPEPYR